MAKVRSIGVFCGSKFGERTAYRDAAQAVGESIARHGARLVYGGGDVGLMGTSASAAAQAGGDVLGIIPGFLIAREGHLDGVEVRIVDTMGERKGQLIRESDAYIILPGGTGTLEEVFDVVSRQQLGLHDKPIVFLNIDGFWEKLVELIRHTVTEGFTPHGMADHLHIEDDPETAITYLLENIRDEETAL